MKLETMSLKLLFVLSFVLKVSWSDNCTKAIPQTKYTTSITFVTEVLQCTLINSTFNAVNTSTNLTVSGLTAGNIYDFWLSCTGCTNESTVVGFKVATKPDVISNLSVTDVTTSSVSLAWSSPSGNHLVFRVRWSGFQTDVQNTSISINNLMAATLYTFNVTAVAMDNQTEGDASCILQYTRPGKPWNISATNQGDSSLSVFWSPPQGYVGCYEVTSSNDQLNFTQSYNVSTNFTTLSQLHAGTVYNLTVTSVSGNFRNMSDIVQVATKPSPPGAINTEQKTNSSLTFSWNKPLDVSAQFNYSITCTSSTVSQTQTLATVQTRAQLLGLSSGTQYNISVETVGPQGLRSDRTLKSDYTLPNPVQNLQGCAVSTTWIAPSWRSPDGAQPYYMYKVDISNSSGLGRSLTTQMNSINFTDLQPATKYNVTVTSAASNDTFGRPQSTLCQTKPRPVDGLTAVAVSNTEVKLMWTSQSYSSNAYVYLVFISQQNVINNTINNSITISDLIPGSNYTFTVTAVVNTIQSDPATVSCFTNPEKTSNIKAVGTTTNLTVTWDRPKGSVTSYTVTVYSNSSVNVSQTVFNNSAVFSGLKPGQVYSIRVTTQSGSLNMDSEIVQNATLPNPPNSIKVEGQTTSSVNISWAQPTDMSLTSYHFAVLYEGKPIPTSKNWMCLENLTSGNAYNISVVTVGPMEYLSTPVTVSGCTSLSPVKHLQGVEIATSNITLVWEAPTSAGTYNYLVNVTYPNQTVVSNFTINSTVTDVGGLQSGTNYTFKVTAVAVCVSSDAVSISLFTRPYPIGQLNAVALSSSVVYLNWTRPLEYQNSYSFRVETLGCILLPTNQLVQVGEAQVSNLIPGTNCFFRIYSQAANGIEGNPVIASQYTWPEKVTLAVSNEGTNNSINVMWSPPQGNVEKYVVTLMSLPDKTQEFNSGAQSCVFTSLTAGTIYYAKVTTKSGPFSKESDTVSNATYPNKPGAITTINKTTSSISLGWRDATNIDYNTSFYVVEWISAESSNSTNASTNSLVLLRLASGTSYNISVTTVGPMGYKSESVKVQLLTTQPGEVQALEVKGTSTEWVLLRWSKPSDFKAGYQYSVKTPNSRVTTTEPGYKAVSLLPGTEYSFGVAVLTSDGTEGSQVVRTCCTDAAPVTDLQCQGPNLTAAILVLTWTNPVGLNAGFRVSMAETPVDDVPTCEPICNHTIRNLLYYADYTVNLITLGCGQESRIVDLSCRTGITVPPVPDAQSYVQVTDQEHNRFTLTLNPRLFNNSGGPVLNYGVLVTSDLNSVSGENLSSLIKYLNITYDAWLAGYEKTYLAVVKDYSGAGRSDGNTTVTIGDNTEWQNYTNGPLKAKGSYSFAAVMFTHLETKDGFVDISRSYVSISPFYGMPVNLPENPVVVASVTGVMVCLLILIILVIIAAVIFKRQKKPEHSEVPIHSLRAKVSVPVRVEHFEEYFRKQQANSNCGFAEEFENLKTVGIAQSKTSAQALENKGKNRYNNVLPYDLSRVKLSVHGNQFDDYINANYIPGSNSKKEFIAAQGPLPSTVAEFWRMIWEKNVRTLVMLTRCNEQGRVKCEQYWPSGNKHFNNISVTTTSEIVLEDWTIRDFDVKNLKTAENRFLRHFHFTAWPDHGVPETTELLISFRHLVREHMDEFSRHAPTVVHCSAGVGRTGTFIAIDRLIFQIERESTVDVYGIVHDLRMHRPLMVQTEDQYVFLNKCALDFIRSRTGTNVDLIYQNTAALSIYENFEAMKKSKTGYHLA